MTAGLSGLETVSWALAWVATTRAHEIATINRLDDRVGIEAASGGPQGLREHEQGHLSEDGASSSKAAKGGIGQYF